MSGGIRLKKHPMILKWHVSNERSPIRKMHNAFSRSLEAGIKRRQKFVAPFNNPPGFKPVIEGTFWQGKLRYVIERSDEPANQASLSAWELVNVAKIQTPIFTPDFIAKTNKKNLRTKRGRGHLVKITKKRKPITPRYQVPRLNRLIVKDVKKRFSRMGIVLNVRHDPFEAYRASGDGA